MQLSARTLQILKNFASINPSIQFKTGNVVSTVSPQKTVLAKATVAEKFDRTFAIFELNRFLGVLSLFDKPTIETHEKFLWIKDGGQQIRYAYADPSMIVVPPEKQLSGEYLNEFPLDSSNLSKLMKAVAVLQAPEIKVACDGESVVVSTHDSKQPNADVFEFSVKSEGDPFSKIFKVDNFKLLVGDYTVGVTDRYACFDGNDIMYWITTESK